LPFVVSAVKDREPGVAASHGLEKLTAALRAKGFVCEDAATPAEAHGKLLVVAGLGDGGGPASELLKAGHHPAPQGPDRRNQEFHSTVADLKILASLAQYHAQRIPAAVSYRLFERTQDPDRLEDAISCERNAIEAWRQLVAAAGDVYTDDLMMGVRGASLCGHWKDELAALERGLSAMEQRRRELQPAAQAKSAPRYASLAGDGHNQPPDVTHRPVTTAPVGQPLTITAQVRDPSGVKWVRLRYRNVNQHEDYRTLSMLPAGDTDRYLAVVPAEHVVPDWDLMYLIEVMDNRGNGQIYPDFNQETPYIVVRLSR